MPCTSASAARKAAARPAPTLSMIQHIKKGNPMADDAESAVRQLGRGAWAVARGAGSSGVTVVAPWPSLRVRRHDAMAMTP